MRWKYLAGAAALAVLLALFLYSSGGGHTPQGQPPLRALTAQNIAEIKDKFNAAEDDVRVLLLLSPT